MTESSIWLPKGETGEKGPTGDPGPVGPQGPEGPPGPGATEFALFRQDRMSVKDFGATGNGISNDTIFFQNAAAANKNILIPTGSYNLTEDVVGDFEFQYGVVFTGAGIAKSKGRQFWTDVSPGADIHRFTDRIFVAEAAKYSRGVQEAGSEGTWLITDMGANYFEREAQMLVVSGVGEYGGVFATRTSDKSILGNYGDSSVAIAGIVQNDSASPTQIGWASYFEANRITNISTFGTEFAVKNRGNDTTANPYNYFGGAVGAWFAGGGDGSYNGAPTNPSDTAILIGKNAASWNKGIVFGKDAITGSDGVTGNGVAIDFAKGHKVSWSFDDSGTVRTGSEIIGNVGTVNAGQSLVFGNGSFSIKGRDASGGLVDWAIFGGPVAASGGSLNAWFFGAQAAGTGYVNLQATGADSNIDCKLTPKGSGILRLGYQAQTASNASAFNADNYLQIRLNDGTVFYAAGKAGSAW